MEIFRRYVQGGINMRYNPKPGEFYKHFKNKIYQIVNIATHSETKEKLVIYQALYGDFGVYARPLDMFLSEVDKEKYPDVGQKYRFEKIDISEQVEKTEALDKSEDEELKKDVIDSSEVEDTKFAEDYFIKFLEAEDFSTKKKILLANKSFITEKQLDAMFDIYGLKRKRIDIEIDIADFIAYLNMQQHFEGKRLR